MPCPRCGKSRSYQMNFYFEKKKVRLVAQVCKVCEYIWAEDDDLVHAARQHLKALCQQPSKQ